MKILLQADLPAKYTFFHFQIIRPTKMCKFEIYNFATKEQ